VKPSADSDRLLVKHMLDCIGRIRDYTAGGRAEFFSSRLVQDAVMRNLQTMSESSQRLSSSIKTSEPGIPWTKIAGMRNILVHQYLGGIDLDVVWRVVEADLPSLAAALDRLRAALHSKRSP
jgi:uncharacterized protein with HEPN domain